MQKLKGGMRLDLSLYYNFYAKYGTFGWSEGGGEFECVGRRKGRATRGVSFQVNKKIDCVVLALVVELSSSVACGA